MPVIGRQDCQPCEQLLLLSISELGRRVAMAVKASRLGQLASQWPIPRWLSIDRWFGVMVPIRDELDEQQQYDEGCNDGRDRSSHADFGCTLLMAYSASAVIVKLGLTPGLPGTTEPSTMNRPG